jgi:hypothetical protein
VPGPWDKVDDSWETNADWPFQDAYDLPDDMWSMIEVGRYDPGPISHFVRVLWFHFDYENGGLVQVIYNLKQARRERIEDYAQSFEELGLAPLAIVIRWADRRIAGGHSWQSIFDRRPKDDDDLDLLYNALAYGRPGAYRNDLGWCEDRLYELGLTGEDGEAAQINWVARAALKYARDHRAAFRSFVDQYCGEAEC